MNFSADQTASGPTGLAQSRLDMGWHAYRARHPWLLGLVLGLAALFLLVWRYPPEQAHVFQGLAAYLPLHSFLEVIAIAVAALVFGIGWHAHDPARPRNLLILSCGFLAVALLDFAHAMSYKGMPEFVTEAGTEKAINFWLLARYTAAVTLLVAVLVPWRPLRYPWARFAVLGTSLAWIGLAYWLGLYRGDWFPHTFIPGQGLTQFKVNAEYVLVGLSVATAIGIYGLGKLRYRLHLPSLLAAVVVIALSELCFTLYSEVTDAFNLLGHVYKVVAYLLIYRAVFIEAVQAPYIQMYESERQLYREKERLRITLHAIGDAVLTVDRFGRVEFLNPMGERMTGRHNREAKGKPLPEVLHLRDADRSDLLKAELARVLKGEISQAYLDGKCLMASRDKDFVAEISLSALRDEKGHTVGAAIVCQDVTERSEFEQRLQYQAGHDPLTQLPNRLALHESLSQAMGEARINHSKVAVLFLDLDRFKDVNDTLGHDIGDQLLRVVANRLSQCMRRSDVVGRMGGDEFMAILKGLNRAEDCLPVCTAIRDAFSKPCWIGEQEFHIECSIGISLFPQDGEDERVLVRNADIAMYNAKGIGRNTYRYYSKQMNAALVERLEIEQGLRHALDHGELYVCYQPRVDVARGGVVGAEALVRWRHPEGKQIGPDKFIPVAEQSGLIGRIGEFVLHTACRDAKVWRDRGFDGVRVGVNFSASQFRDPALVDKIRLILAETALPPDALEMELTEGTLMEDAESTLAVWQQLDHLGVQMVIDDFGTGFSSLSYLKQLPVDLIKIDRSFVTDITSNASGEAIVRAVIAMAGSLQVNVMAEGVETEEQLAYLKTHGCHEVQGYYFSKPLPVDQFFVYLQENCQTA